MAPAEGSPSISSSATGISLTSPIKERPIRTASWHRTASSASERTARRPPAETRHIRVLSADGLARRRVFGAEIDLGGGVTVELMFSPNTNHPLSTPPGISVRPWCLSQLRIVAQSGARMATSRMEIRWGLMLGGAPECAPSCSCAHLSSRQGQVVKASGRLPWAQSRPRCRFFRCMRSRIGIR